MFPILVSAVCFEVEVLALSLPPRSLWEATHQFMEKYSIDLTETVHECLLMLPHLASIVVFESLFCIMLLSPDAIERACRA